MEPEFAAIVEFTKRNMELCIGNSTDWSVDLWEKVLEFEWDKNDTCRVPKEAFLFKHLQKWSNYNKDNRNHFSRLCRKVRFPRFTQDDMNALVRGNDILTDMEFDSVMTFIDNSNAERFGAIPFNCKPRRYFQVRTSEEFQQALTTPLLRYYIKLCEGTFEGSFSCSLTNLHIVGCGPEKSVISATSERKEEMINFELTGSSFHNISFEVPKAENLTSRQKTVKVKGSRVTFSNVAFSQTRLCLEGQFFNVQNVDFDDNFSDSQARLFGNFTCSYFKDIYFTKSRLSVYLNKMCQKNYFKKIFFARCCTAFLLVSSDFNIFKEISYNFFPVTNRNDTYLFDLRGSSHNLIKETNSFVSSSPRHVSVRCVNETEDNAKSRYNFFVGIKRGDIVDNGLGNAYTSCQHLDVMEIRDSTDITVHECEGQELRDVGTNVNLFCAGNSFCISSI